METIVPSTITKMPDVPYQWNETHIDIILQNPNDDETVKEKNITYFFTGLEVTGLSSGNIKRIINAGYDSLPKILAMNKDDFLEVEGFKDKMANKVFTSIRDKLKETKLAKFMASTNLFGRGLGEKRIQLILNKYPNIVISNDTLRQKLEKIKTIDGFAEKTAKNFVDNIENFIDFINETGLQSKLITKELQEQDISHPLYNKSIILTGFRDKEIERKIKEKGGKIGTSISKNTFFSFNKK